MKRIKGAELIQFGPFDLVCPTLTEQKSVYLTHYWTEISSASGVNLISPEFSNHCSQAAMA